MADGRYDDLKKQRDQERADAATQDDRERTRRDRFRQHYVVWRNGVKTEIDKRAKELEQEYPHLHQLFVQDIQDDLSVRKSYHPAGTLNVHFDEQAQSLSCEFRIYGSTREVQNTFSMAYVLDLAPDDSIVIKDGGQVVPTDRFVHTIFDAFMPHVM